MVRILFFSDWRIQPIELAESMIHSVGSVDAIIYGGDDTSRFITNNGENIFAKLASSTKYGLGAILGNDCKVSHRSIITGDGANHLFDLHTQGMKVDQWGIIGIEGAIRHKRTDTEYWINGMGYICHNDDSIEDHLIKQTDENHFQMNRLIIVSHTPPYGKLDTGTRFGVEHLGSPSLLRFIENYQPALVLSGHCHSSGGKSTKVGNTIIVNSASDDVNVQHTRMALVEFDDTRDPKIEWIDPTPHSVIYLQFVGLKKAEQLLKHNIVTPDDLLKLPDEQIIGHNLGIGSKAIAIARMQQKAKDIGSLIRIKNEPITIPDPLIYYDVETGLSLNREPHNPWLIAMIGPDGQMFQSYELDNTIQQRRKMYEQVISFIRQYPGASMCSWSGRGFDVSAVSYGIRKNAPELVNEWRNLQQYDPLPILQDQFILPFGVTWSIKSIFPFLFPDQMENEDFDGFDVGLWYEFYKKYGETFDVQKVCQYNMKDVIKLKQIVEWMRSGQCESLPITELIDKRYLKDRNRYERIWAEAVRLGISNGEARLLGLNRLIGIQTKDEAIQAIIKLSNSKAVNTDQKYTPLTTDSQNNRKSDDTDENSYIKLMEMFSEKGKGGNVINYTIDELAIHSGIDKSKLERLLLNLFKPR